MWLWPCECHSQKVTLSTSSQIRNVILWAYECEHELMNMMEYFWASFDDVDEICLEYYLPHWTNFLLNEWQMDELFGWKNIERCYLDKFGHHR